MDSPDNPSLQNYGDSCLMLGLILGFCFGCAVSGVVYLLFRYVF